MLVPFLSLFGSVGNIMSLRVLSRMRMRNVINLVLAALAVSDLLFLLHALFFSFLKLYGLRDPTAGARLRWVHLSPCSLTLMTHIPNGWGQTQVGTLVTMFLDTYDTYTQRLGPDSGGYTCHHVL